MSTVSVSVLDHAIQDVNIWLNALVSKLTLPDKNRAYRILRAVLHALRDMLGVDEAADLAAQMPMLIRGIYFEGWNPSSVPTKERDLSDFIGMVQRDFRFDPLEKPNDTISAVFELLSEHITAGEIEQVRNALRKEIRELWKIDVPQV